MASNSSKLLSISMSSADGWFTLSHALTLVLQVDSKAATSPAFAMGHSGRFSDKNPTRDVPGAGSYASAFPAYGKQVLSGKATLPSPKMGTSTRDSSKKIFISKEHEKATYGENSPGPASGPMVASFGVQTLSNKKTNPTIGFGTSKVGAKDSRNKGGGALLRGAIGTALVGVS